MIKNFFAQYKSIFYLAAFIAYSIFVWKTAQDVKENKYLKETQAALQAAADQKQFKQDVADQVGAVVAKKLAGLSTNLGKLRDDLSNQLNEAPVYRECVTTPDVVRNLDDTRNTVNQAIGK